MIEETQRLKPEGLPLIKTISHYFHLIKPRETVLLTFIGVSAAILAGNGAPALSKLSLVFMAVLIGSAGVNGLTNYLDREVDGKMLRTCGRVLPSRRIYPAEKALPVTVTLVVIALALAWILNPLCFLFGIIGTVTAVILRKTGYMHLLGIISGTGPVLIGWLAVRPEFEATIIYLSVLVGLWIPIHVWSVMLANRQDYVNAGVNVFPLTWKQSNAFKVLLMLAVILYTTSILLYFSFPFNRLYLVTANILGLAMIFGNIRLLQIGASKDAWRLYKYSAFPYLGILFLAMCLDVWLF